MSRSAILGFALASALAAAPAVAQETTTGSVYVGVVGGYHDLGVEAPGKDGGPILGGVLGFDVPISGPVVIGIEGNFHFGLDAIDDEYGLAARLGYRFPSGGIFYVRGGYQWVDVDVNKFAGANVAGLGIEDLADDYLVGVGGEFPLGKPGLRVRAGIDTVSFDSIRPTVGVIFGF